MTLEDARKSFEAINLKHESFGGNLWLYRSDGSLLRSFLIYGLGSSRAWIDDIDYLKWWRFMGYDK